MKLHKCNDIFIIKVNIALYGSENERDKIKRIKWSVYYQF